MICSLKIMGSVYTQMLTNPGFPAGAGGKEPACQCRRHKRHGFDSWVGKIRWSRAQQPTSVFLPGESHGQRSLAGYSPWDRKESDTSEATLEDSKIKIPGFELPRLSFR